MKPILGVIFDMDGVLCDSEPIICEAACRMFELRHKVMVRPEAFEPFVGMGEDRYLGGVAEAYGVSLDMPSDKEYTYELYLELIKGRLRPLKGVGECLAALRRDGVKTAVATSADAMKMRGNLREIGEPPERFDALVCGSEVGRKKPFPDIFIEAASRLGLEPAVCVVVEDAPAGLRAARDAGCACIGVASSFAAAVLTEQHPLAIVDDLDGVRALIARWRECD